MNRKPYELGLIVGRFQTVHLGHEMMIRTALELCERVGIFIGSAQESGTQKNPFSYEVREGMLRALFGSAVEVRPLPDAGLGNNARWGEYVLAKAKEAFGRLPDLAISGKEERRGTWYDCKAGESLAELAIPKTIEISASQMRDFFLRDDVEAWKAYTSPALWGDYARLRALTLSAQENRETDSI